jgi:SHS2 domain-containing protein
MTSSYSRKDLEFLDHTGDIGIRLRAGSLEALFSRAGMAMFEIICPTGERSAVERRKIAVDAGDLEQLLVNWLSELNYIFQTEHFLMAKVQHIHIEAMSLQAEIAGGALDHKVHEIHTEIKAVTFHDIFVKKTNKIWEAQVIFDI